MTLTVFHSGYASGTPSGTECAVAVAGSVISAVGPEAEALIPIADHLHDLQGGYLGPAFGDGHAHPLFAGLEDVGPQIRTCTTLEEVLAAVGTWASENPGADWIVGASYDATLAPDGRFDARWLDKAVPDRPVMLRAWDYHTIWVNSKALEIAGITSTTPEPALGAILRRGDGSPLGTLCEPGAIDLVARHVPSYGPEVHVAALDRATASLAKAGVTWVQDAWVELDAVGHYLAAARSKALNTRMNLAFRADPVTWRSQLPGFESARAQVDAAHEELLSANTIKFFLDGIVESHTAHMLDPYSDRDRTHGLPNWDPDSLTRAAIAVDAMGFQLHLHAIGDAAVRQGLDAIEAVIEANGNRDRRPVMAHLQAVSPQDLPRFKALGVVANFEPLWAQCDAVMTELTFPRLGRDRSARQFQMGEIAAAGVPVSFGSDWPVTHHHPMAGIAVAVTRTGSAEVGQAPLPGARFGVDEALDSYSRQVAFQGFAEHERGTLAPGMLADLVWLEQDPRSADPAEFPGLKVLGTWLAGSPTHLAAGEPLMEGSR